MERGVLVQRVDESSIHYNTRHKQFDGNTAITFQKALVSRIGRTRGLLRGRLAKLDALANRDHPEKPVPAHGAKRSNQVHRMQFAFLQKHR